MRASFFAASEDAFFLLDTRGRLRFVNPAFARLFDQPADSFRGLSCRSRRKPTLDDPFEDHLAALLHTSAEALHGEPHTVRRVLRRPAPAATFDVSFLPLRRGSALQWIGRLRRISTGTVATAPLPEPLIALRQRHVNRWDLDLLGDPAGRLAVQVRLAARVRCAVLLVGPMGCGKATVARVIHYHSAERERPMAVLALRPLTPTRLKELLSDTRGPGAPGAIVLRGLDHCPAPLIQVLAEWLRPEWEGQPTDPARPRVFATLRDRPALPTALEPLSGFVVSVPALQERIGEWPLLLERMRERMNLLPGHAIHSFTPSALEALRAHAWPGNLRELGDVLLDARTGCRSGVIDRADLPAWLRVPVSASGTPANLDLEATLQQAERRLILLALHRARGNRSRAAEMLGLTRARLQRRLDQLGLGESEAGG
jgi:hypothetical protein